MKSVCILSLLVLTLALAKGARIRRDDKYTTKYDTINVEEILNSERLLLNYHKCLMDEGKCTPDAAELKQIIPDALQTKCSKCSESQKEGAEKVIKFLIKEKPELWKPLEEKYDPDGTFRKKYEEEEKRLIGN